MSLRSRLTEALGRPVLTKLREQVRQGNDSLDLLQERLAELEFSLEDASWQRLNAETQHEFSRAGLRQIARLARIYWLKNPLIKRAVEVQQTYVFGQGVNIHAPEAPVDKVIQAFLGDAKNQAALTSHQAMLALEAELQVESNIFFAFFTNPARGTVRVRTIPCREVEDVIFNPEDRADPWFYVRTWTPTTFDAQTGQGIAQPVTVYYPDWRHKPKGRPDIINGCRVAWDSPVYHVAVNKLGDMKFGVPEMYAALDWAKAYKQFLEDWATIVRSYARFAWQFETKGGKAGVASAKARFETTLSADNGVDRNPPPATASTLITTEAGKMTPLKTAGATTSAKDGRRILLMVAAATGIYEHYFGDPSTGNLATSTSMERPMEIKFLTRRQLWADVFDQILGYVKEQAVRARVLPGDVHLNEYDEEVATLGPNPDAEGEDAGEPMTGRVNIDFPPLLDHNIQERINAIVAAATLNGQSPAGIIDEPTIARMVLTALGEDDVGELVEKMFPEGWEEERAQQQADKVVAMQRAMGKTDQADGDVAEALRDLREAIVRLRDHAAAA